jgi:hypothetical protein
VLLNNGEVGYADRKEVILIKEELVFAEINMSYLTYRICFMQRGRK